MKSRDILKYTLGMGLKKVPEFRRALLHLVNPSGAALPSLNLRATAGSSLCESSPRITSTIAANFTVGGVIFKYIFLNIFVPLRQ